MPCISVIIPVYNAEKYIKNTLLSVQNQTLTDIEIIVVNDGSEDSSLSICQSAEINDSRIKILNQKNQGVSAARNIGKKIATGEYTIFIDADDEMNENMLEQLYTNAIRFNADISICAVKRIDGDKLPDRKTDILKFSEIKPNVALHLLMLGKKIESGVWNKLFKSSLIRSIDFVVGKRINEDKFFLFNALCKAQKIIFTNTELYYYYNRENSVTNLFFLEQWFDSLYFADCMYSIIVDNYKSLEPSARFQLIQTYYSVLRRLYPYDKKYMEKTEKIISTIKKINLNGIHKYLSNKQLFGILLIKYFTPGYRCLRAISNRVEKN